MYKVSIFGFHHNFHIEYVQFKDLVPWPSMVIIIKKASAWHSHQLTHNFYSDPSCGMARELVWLGDLNISTLCNLKLTCPKDVRDVVKACVVLS